MDHFSLYYRDLLDDDFYSKMAHEKETEAEVRVNSQACILSV